MTRLRRVVASWKPELAISWEKSIRKFVVPRKYQSNFTQEICITLINFYPYSLSLWAWKVFELNLIEFFHPHIIQFTEGSEFSTISHDITFFSHFTHPSQLVDIFSPNENLLFENRSHNTLFLFFSSLSLDCLSLTTVRLWLKECHVSGKSWDMPSTSAFPDFFLYTSPFSEIEKMLSRKTHIKNFHVLRLVLMAFLPIWKIYKSKWQKSQQKNKKIKKNGTLIALIANF